MVLMVHTMIGIYNLALSLCKCKSGVGTLSLYTIRGFNCVSLQFGSFMSGPSTIHNLEGSKKMSSRQSPVSRHVLIDMLNLIFSVYVKFMYH